MLRKLLIVLVFAVVPALAQAGEAGPVMRQWYRLVLELVRHTATYSPPVASRSFAYLGVTGYEVVASGTPGLTSLAGQLNGLTPLPRRPRMVYDEAVVMQAAMALSVRALFGNTGPSGQQAMDRMQAAIDTIRTAFAIPGELRAADFYLPQFLPPADQLRFPAAAG